MCPRWARRQFRMAFDKPNTRGQSECVDTSSEPIVAPRIIAAECSVACGIAVVPGSEKHHRVVLGAYQRRSAGPSWLRSSSSRFGGARAETYRTLAVFRPPIWGAAALVVAEVRSLLESHVPRPGEGLLVWPTI